MPHTAIEYAANLEEVADMGALAQAVKTKPVSHLEVEFTYQIPVPSPEKIICVGVNYPARNDEHRDGKEAPENMSLFVRCPRSIVGHGMPLTRPKVSDKL